MHSKLLIAAASLLVAQSAFASENQLIDTVYGAAASGPHVKMLRAGATSDWKKDWSWFNSNGTHVTGYWDASIGFWRGNQAGGIDGNRQTLWDLGFTPVFRFENVSKKGIYYEGGIGIHMLSKRYDNSGNQLSTHLQFGDHIGIGYVLNNGWDLGAKFQHYSNGGYKKPNSGANFVVLKAARHF